MTEVEWNACTDPQDMLGFLHQGAASERKLRLFAAGCCRHIERLLPSDVGCREAIQAAEQAADAPPHSFPTKVVSAAAAATAAFAAAAVGCPDKDEIAAYAAHAAFASSCLTGTGYADNEALVWSVAADADAAEEYFEKAELGFQASLLRCIFGPHPFRQVNVCAAWRTPTVKQLAESIYSDRAYDRLLFLADALEDAECDSEAILNHCRHPGVHARGCWALDLVLGKE